MSRIVSWLRSIAALEPVYVRTFIGAAVVVAGVWGIDIAGLGGQLEVTLNGIVVAATVALTMLGIRDRVTPTAAVVARVDDPKLPPDQVMYLAGGYSEAPTGAAVGRRARLRDLTSQGAPSVVTHSRIEPIGSPPPHPSADEADR